MRQRRKLPPHFSVQECAHALAISYKTSASMPKVNYITMTNLTRTVNRDLMVGKRPAALTTFLQSVKGKVTDILQIFCTFTYFKNLRLVTGVTHRVLSKLAPYRGFWLLRSATKRMGSSPFPLFLLPETQNSLSSRSPAATQTCLVHNQRQQNPIQHKLMAITLLVKL